MQLDKCLYERRSVRNYEDKHISWSMISDILDAARQSPSSGNVQNFRFIVIQDEKRRKEISKIAFNQEWISKAPVHIVVCGDLKSIRIMYGKRGEELYTIQNCSIAAYSIMLKAFDLSLGSCWVGAFDDKKLSEFLKLPKDVIPFCIITLGVKKGPKEESKRHPQEYFISFEEYGNLERDISIQPLEKPVKRLKKKIKKALKKK